MIVYKSTLLTKSQTFSIYMSDYDYVDTPALSVWENHEIFRGVSHTHFVQRTNFPDLKSATKYFFLSKTKLFCFKKSSFSFPAGQFYTKFQWGFHASTNVLKKKKLWTCGSQGSIVSLLFLLETLA